MDGWPPSSGNGNVGPHQQQVASNGAEYLVVMLAAYYVFAILGMDIFGGLLVREHMATEAHRLECPTQGGLAGGPPGRELCKNVAAAAAVGGGAGVLLPNGTNVGEGVLTFPQVCMGGVQIDDDDDDGVARPLLY